MRYEEAIASFECSVSIKPENAQALNGKGVALFYAGNNTLALVASDQAVRTDPGFIKSWNNRAFVFVKQEKYEKTVNAYQTALSSTRRQADPKGTGDFLFDTMV